jgi:hypothetical protein
MILAQEAETERYWANRFFEFAPRPRVCDPIPMIAMCQRRAERKIALAVMLRLTAMDVCCGPPAARG